MKVDIILLWCSLHFHFHLQQPQRGCELFYFKCSSMFYLAHSNLFFWNKFVDILWNVQCDSNIKMKNTNINEKRNNTVFKGNEVKEKIKS